MDLTVYFDGNCRPNPHGVGVIGFCVEESDGTVVVRKQGYLGEGAPLSQNLSEWCALLGAARYFQKLYDTHSPLFVGDAQIVVDSLADGVAVPGLGPVQSCVHEAVRGVLDDIGGWRIKRISGQENERADGLANSVYGSLKTGQHVPDYRDMLAQLQ